MSYTSSIVPAFGYVIRFNIAQPSNTRTGRLIRCLIKNIFVQLNCEAVKAEIFEIVLYYRHLDKMLVIQLRFIFKYTFLRMSTEWHQDEVSSSQLFLHWQKAPQLTQSPYTFPAVYQFFEASNMNTTFFLVACITKWHIDIYIIVIFCHWLCANICEHSCY